MSQEPDFAEGSDAQAQGESGVVGCLVDDRPQRVSGGTEVGWPRSRVHLKPGAGRETMSGESRPTVGVLTD